MTPTQHDWDVHLLRVYVSDKYKTMREAEFDFFKAHRQYPRELGFLRTSRSNMMVYAYVESIPGVAKAITKYGKHRLEEIAAKLGNRTGIICGPKSHTRKDAKEHKQDKTDRQRLAVQLALNDRYKRSEQWKVCK